MRVYVTQDDIDKGDKADCRYCPIALALRRPMPTTDIEVGADFITMYRISRLTTVEQFYEAALPWLAGVFVANFDTNRAVAPFHFDIPTPSVNL